MALHVAGMLGFIFQYRMTVVVNLCQWLILEKDWPEKGKLQ